MPQIVLTKGRRLCYIEYGVPSGVPVIYFHGFPGSHIEFEMIGDQLVKDLNIRLISVSRPGYSDSDPLYNHTLLDWPDDITALADTLSIDKFSVIGLSGGGPYVLACAYKIPNRIKKAVVVSGMGPVSAPGAKDIPAWSIIKWPGFIQNIILMGFKKLIDSDPEKFLANMNKSIAKVDLETLKNDELTKRFIAALKEALKNGYKGAKEDAKIYKRDWGFELKDVEHEVLLWHGEKDINVKIETAKYVAAQLPNCISNFYPNEGHLSLIDKYALEIFKEFVIDQ